MSSRVPRAAMSMRFANFPPKVTAVMGHKADVKPLFWVLNSHGIYAWRCEESLTSEPIGKAALLTYM
jgi:hypothetical protein